MHFHDLKHGWLYPHLCSICYLSRSLHQVHVPPTAVWFSSCPIRHSVEWNRWSSTTATWSVPTCRNHILAKFQHQQFAEVHQQPPRFQPTDHLVSSNKKNHNTNHEIMSFSCLKSFRMSARCVDSGPCLHPYLSQKGRWGPRMLYTSVPSAKYSPPTISRIVAKPQPSQGWL